jgi:hypothetical protein
MRRNERSEAHCQWDLMKWLSTLCLFLCLNACFRHEERELSGPSLLDSTGVLLKSSGSLRNVEEARIIAVIERHHSELRGEPPDSCGSGPILLTADVEMGDGRRIVLTGQGASPCDAGAPPITETIELGSEGRGIVPKDKIRSIQLRSSKLVTLRSVEWQTWEQGP